VTAAAELAADAAALRAFVERQAVLLAQLPRKDARYARERERANELLDSCRRLRESFLGQHAGPVYDSVTDGRTTELRLPELVRLASERFPGLLPSRDELRDDRARPLAEKDGWELDVAIFLRAVLRLPVQGDHLVGAMLRPTARAQTLLPQFRSDGRIDLGTVLVERRSGVAYLTFQKARSLHAEDERFVADLEVAVDLALLDDGVSVGVLRGGRVDHPRYAGRRVFCAGINLRELRAGRIGLVEFLVGRELGFMNKIARGLREGEPPATREKPWLAVVEGFAIGGGLQMVLVCDRVVAERGAYVSLPAAAEGIVPGLANLRLTRVAGARLARRLVLAGARVAAEDEAGRLFFDDVAERPALDAAVEEAVHDLARPAVVPNRRLLLLAEEPPALFREYVAEFAVAQALRLQSPDLVANLTAWEERRATKAEAG
jgi:thioesterase DpgC